MEISLGDDDSALGIIGGADGPTAIFIGPGKKPDSRSACSAVHLRLLMQSPGRFSFGPGPTKTELSD